jgi:nucleoside phosphorylase
LSTAVDVAILFALEEESNCLEPFLKEQPRSERDDKSGRAFQLFSVCPSDDYTYKCVTTFVGSMGAQDAGHVTALLLRRYSPRTIVLVGIAGSLDSDILVGDVVVAETIEDYFQDGRVEDGRFAAAGRVYRPHTRLMNVARHLRKTHPVVWQRLREQSSTDAADAVCTMKNPETVSALIRGGGLKIAVGHIASGPVVGTARSFASWLKTLDRKFLALEMESAGVMNAIYQCAGDERALIVRGISDLSDERKKQLDTAGSGVFRGLAMRNALRLIMALFESGAFEHREGVNREPLAVTASEAFENSKEDSVQEQFRTRSEAFDSLSRYRVQNKVIFDTYGPMTDHRFDPESGIPKLWRRHVLESILPNNRAMLRLIDNNAHLLTVAENIVVERFRIHVADFEQRHLQRSPHGEGQQFPPEVDLLFSEVEHSNVTSTMGGQTPKG